MAGNMKQIEVQIMGQSYLLACPEGGEQRLLEAVEKVDSAMCRIRDAGKVKARDRIAVLAALNLAFDVDKSSASAASAPSVVSAPSPEGATNGAGSNGSLQDDARLAGLLHRLDTALNVDGHLI